MTNTVPSHRIVAGLVLAGLLLAGLGAPAAWAQGNNPWPVEGQNPQRTKQSPVSANTGAWSEALGSDLELASAPVVGPSGNIFATVVNTSTADRRLVKFNVGNGSTTETSIPDDATGLVIKGDTLLYSRATTAPPTLEGVKTTDLSETFTYSESLSSNDPLRFLSAPVVRNSTAYVAVGIDTSSVETQPTGKLLVTDDEVWAIDLDTGTRKWRQPISTKIGKDVVVRPGGDLLVKAGTDTIKTVVDNETNASVSEFARLDLGGEVGGLSVASSGAVYVVDRISKDLIKFDQAGGEQWTTSFSGAVQQTAPVVDGSNVYLPSSDTLRAHNSTNGELKWAKPVGRLVQSIAVANSGNVYTVADTVSTTTTPVLRKHDANSNGAVVSQRSLTAGDPIPSGLALANDGTAYVPVDSVMHSVQVGAGLQHTSRTPGANQEISRTGTPELDFSAAVDGTQTLANYLEVRGRQSGPLSGTVSGGGTQTLTFAPDSTFAPGETVTVSVLDSLASEGGAQLDTTYTYQLRATAGSGPAAFAGSTVVSTSEDGARAVAAGDLDGDGDPDLVVGSEQAGTVTRYLNQGDGSFGTGSVVGSNVNSARDVALADLDGQNGLDIIVAEGQGASGSDDEISWFPNDGSGSFGSREDVAVAGNNIDDPRSVATGDLDGDADVDVVAAGDDGSTIFWYRNDGSGGFTKETVTSSANTPRDVAVGDISGDGILDVAWTDVSSDSVAWAPNDGSGSFGGASTIGGSHTNPAEVALADVNGNGLLDAVIAAEGEDAVRVVYDDGTAGTFRSAGTDVPTSVSGANAVHPADVDGDGDLDVLAAARQGGKLYSFTNDDGTESFTLDKTFETNASQAEDVVAADLDGDAALDAIGAAYGNDTVAWYANAQTPPTVAVGSASAIDTIQATFTGTVTPNGDTTTVTAEFGRTSGGGLTSTTLTTVNTNLSSSNIPVSGLSPDTLRPSTEYRYRLIAQSSAGADTSTFSTFTTNNVAPTANGDTETTDEDQSVAVDVLANDSDVGESGLGGSLDPSTVTVTTGPQFGSTSVNDPSPGVITYTPAADSNGTDSFGYTVADDSGAVSGEATVDVTVNAVNDTPSVATNQVLPVTEGGSTVIADTTLAVTDVESGPSALEYTVDSQPTNGTLDLSGSAIGVGATFTQADIENGRLAYAHDGSETTSDNAQFTVVDGGGNSVDVTLSIDVTLLDDTPPSPVTIDTPADGALVASQPTISGAAEDDQQISGVSLAIQRANDGDYWTGSAWQAGSTAVAADAADGAFDAAVENWTYDASGITGGDTLTVTATAVDTAGNAGTSSPVTYTIDPTPPAGVTVATPADSTFRRTSAPNDTLEVAYSYQEARPDSVTITLDDGSNTARFGIDDSGYPGNGSQKTVSLDLSAPTTGSLAAGSTYDLTVTARDSVGRTGSATVPDRLTLDETAPTVQQIVRSAPPSDSTNQSSVDVAVTFSEIVENVDPSDFVLAGAPGSPSITGVSADSARTVTVTVGSISGDGLLDLDVSGSPTIQDRAGNGLDPSVGPPTEETYTIDNTAPEATAFTRLSPPTDSTNRESVTFAVSFSEPVTGIEPIAFNAAGTAGGTVTSVTAPTSGDTTVTVSSLSGGSLELNLDGDGTITDPAGNGLLTSSEPATDETYTIDQTAPTVSGLSLAEDTDGNLDLFFETDEPLGDATTDLVVTVDGPSTPEVYTFTRADFGETGSGTYTYTLQPLQPYDDGDGTYTAVVDTARDPAGNDGGGSATASYTIDDVAPSIVGGTASATTNSFVRVTFSEPVYGDSSASDPLTTGDLTTTFTANGDAATGVTVDGLADTTGSALSGGERIVRVQISVSGGPASGLGTVEIGPAGGSAIYDVAGTAMDPSATTGPVSLSDRLAPTISDVRLRDTTDEAFSVQVVSDEPLGTADSSVAVTVDGPNSGADLYSFSRSDFTVSGSGPYTYALDPAQPYGDGDGTYVAVLDAAVDTAGNDGAGGQTASVTVIDVVNDAPTLAAPADTTIDEDTTTGPRTVIVGDEETPAGSLSVTAASNAPALLPPDSLRLGGSDSVRTVTATPTADSNGAAEVTLTVGDGQKETSARFVLTVRPVNDAPIPAPDTFSTVEDQTLSVDAPGLLANDRDIDAGDTLRVDPQPASGPQHGQLTLRESGAFDYDPAPGYNGPDRFVYRAVDTAGVARSDTARIVVREAALTAVADTTDVGVRPVGRGGPPAAVRVRNTGAVPLTGLSASTQGPNAGDVRVLGSDGRGALGPGATRTYEVAFRPADPGRREATLRVTAAEADTAQAVLRGRGVGVDVGVRPQGGAQGTPAGVLRRGRGATVEATLVGGFAPSPEQALAARRGGTGPYRTFDLSVTEALESGTGGQVRLQGRIPDSLVTPRGVDYYLRLIDGPDTLTVPAGGPAAARATPRHLPVQFRRLEAPVRLAPRRYRMVSVPARPEGGIKRALRRTYGRYEASDWRLARWVGGEYRSYPQLDSLRVGAGFWLATRGGDSLRVGPGRTVDADSARHLRLETGWNQIGNPFGFAVRWDTIRAATGGPDGSLLAPVAYRDTSAAPSFDPAYRADRALLRPWQGYFVYRGPEGPDTLVVPPVGADSAAGRARPRALATSPGAGKSADRRYTLRLTARSRTAAPRRVWLGLRAGAEPGRDALDFAQPPPVRQAVRLSVREQVGGRVVPHAGSFKPPAEAGRTWTATLSAPEGGDTDGAARAVRLDWRATGSLPTGHRRYVLDLGAERRLAPGARLELEPGQTRRVRVITGTEAFARKHNDGVALDGFENRLRGNYPNPLARETTIEYTLGAERTVTVEIYNVLGQRVRTLVHEEQQPAGLHRLTWEAENRYGTPVGSGVYFYRIQAGDFAETRKMVVVR